MAVLIPLLAVAAVAAVLVLAWPRRRRTVPWEGRTRSPEEAQRVAETLRDQLDRTYFGEVLARDIWLAVMAAPPGEGAILHAHRDYCGHGLARGARGVMLCEVQDARCRIDAPIAEWTAEADFVAFLARQSDFSCSGWDPAEPLFFTDDDWVRDNQRLTRAGLLQFLDGTPPGA